MADMSDILRRMEHLSLRDLEQIKRYLNAQPYKREHRNPTPMELADIMQHLEDLIEASNQSSDMEEHNARINAALQDMSRFT
ncbi:MAG: hypothetical protein ACOCXR_01565 [Phototrophicaceae bacterium]